MNVQLSQQALLDALVSHQAYLYRLSSTEINNLLTQFDSLSSEMLSKLRDLLDDLSDAEKTALMAGQYTTPALKEVRTLVQTWQASVASGLLESFTVSATALAVYEATYQAKTLANRKIEPNGKTLFNKAKKTPLRGTLFERTTTNPVISPLPVPELVLVSALNVGDLKVNGETVVGTACMQSLELTINNNMEAIRCIGSKKLTATTYLEKIVDVTVNTQYMFSAQSAAYIDFIKTRDTMPLEFSIEDDAGNGYAFQFPQLEVAEANHPDGGGEDTITVDINYNHIRVSPVITRVIAPVTP
ncbi:phage tail tube protein [Acinetobacter sp. AOR38_HL]|uniref:phage tail tube protein n=1 Tax=Acinetobacter sp. AOR38_HL TaxID=2919385 RepID=UPI0022EB9FF9|nr:phage tail tube protein [Acinetobacter sp. AOR38_HL]MDA3468278.1 phage tail tube protein [Acinetobacter sp. AOR38_HL]